MTSHSYAVSCSCGHTGTIKMREGDHVAPYESYSLEGLKGSSYRIAGTASWEEVFAEMKPQCPVCQAMLVPSRVIR